MFRSPDLSVLDLPPAAPSVQSSPMKRVSPLVRSLVQQTQTIAVVDPTTSSIATSHKEQELLLKMVCLLIANGETEEATARKLSVSIEWVRKLVAAPVGMDMIIRMQHDSNPDPAVRIKKMATIALDVQTRLLLSASTGDTTKAKVAQDVADRAFGKAIQVTENRNLNFNLSDAVSVEKALNASREKLARIEEMQKRLSLPIGQIDVMKIASVA